MKRRSFLKKSAVAATLDVRGVDLVSSMLQAHQNDTTW